MDAKGLVSYVGTLHRDVYFLNDKVEKVNGESIFFYVIVKTQRAKVNRVIIKHCATRAG